MPRAIHCAQSPVTAIRSAAATAMLSAMSAFNVSDDRCRASPMMFRGGTIDASSWPRTRNGAGCGSVTRPSLMPRTGSRRLRTQTAMSSPGTPTIMKATCQPFSPNGGFSGYTSAQKSRIAPPRKSPIPTPM